MSRDLSFGVVSLDDSTLSIPCQLGFQQRSTELDYVCRHLGHALFEIEKVNTDAVCRDFKIAFKH